MYSFLNIANSEISSLIDLEGQSTSHMEEKACPLTILEQAPKH